MEPAGLTVGVLTVAGLFNNAVDCFEYVQIGRSFGQRYQNGLLKLDGARLRLSRWGQSVGLSGELEDTQSLPQVLGSAQSVTKAEEILGQILELFADAEGISTKFKTRAGRSKQESLVHDNQTDLEPTALSLHNRMRDLSIKRQNQTGLRQKAKWALYEEKHFKRLIEDITSLVNDLIELFPAAQESQKKLCNAEVAQVADMNGIEALSMLEGAAKSQDKLLEEAVVKAMGQKAPTPNIVFSGSHNSGLQLGHNAGTISNLRWGGSA
ncbi:MAG: hypothetical protein Q9191_005666 [Dirinaria sp. TL-2023a]